MIASTTTSDQTAAATPRRAMFVLSGTMPSAIGAVIALAVMCVGDRLWSDDMLLGGLLLLLTCVCVFWASGIRRDRVVPRFWLGAVSCAVTVMLFALVTHDEVPYSWRRYKEWPLSQEGPSPACPPDNQELTAEMQSADELWSFSSPPRTWQTLCGQAGYAVIRNGKTVKREVNMVN